MNSKRVALIVALLAVSGCATKPAPQPQQPDESRALIEGALKRAESLPAHTSGADAKAPAAVSTGSALSINFAGEARDLLKQVAASRNLKFQVLGAQPHLPLFVIVNVKDVAFEDFLRDVGAQFGQRAHLALTDTSIEVRYRGQ